MREQEFPVTFEPHGKVVHAMPGTTLLEAAARAGITLNTPCGGQGTCGKCKVRVARNAAPPTERERKTFSAAELEGGWRLACQSPLAGPATIEVPETSVLASAFQILGGRASDDGQPVETAVRKQYLELPPPARGDDTADLDRVSAALGYTVKADLDVLRLLPQRLRAWDFKCTAVLIDHRLIDVEEGDTLSEQYAAAFDIGTTTLVGVLLDLTTGQECATVSRMNPQTAHGDDVLSRILLTRDGDEGLALLNGCLIDALDEMILELAQACGIVPERIYEVVCSGNTTMQHLLAGITPAALGEVPFSAAAGHGLLFKAAKLGLHAHPRARAYVFPVIGGFVGGDTVSGIVTTSLDTCGKPTVLVDIGTNGEIVVGHDGCMIAASTAAGPAFEGARITFGMRATTGAIEKVLFDTDVHINVVGNAPPVGLCGSALVDAAAGLLEAGILTSQGLMLSPDQLPPEVPEALRERVVVKEDGAAFVLARAEDAGIDEAVLLTQRDIRELQLATAAIRAGITILLQRCGLTHEDVDRYLIAGGFGNFIRRNHAQRIGLLPPEVERHRIAFVGNTSLAGARLAAVSLEARERAEGLARKVKHIDLSLDPDFQNEYMMAMFFPE